jgi:S-(hydroxymethyl)glutathione dehydrogenase/alcohol dehydrogenase
LKTLAAILVETGHPLVLDEIEIPALKPGQVLVEVALSGVCHTQILECRGFRGPDHFLPHCLGHEGSGTVREIGPGVTKVKPGDKVILSWMQGSGANVPGTVYKWEGRAVNSGAITTFSRYSVISENRLTPMPEGITMRQAAMIGCAVATGLGVVCNTVAAKPGQSGAVFGTGGIGLCAVAGASISGCAPVIAVDIVERKLAVAKEMGATHAVNASKSDPVEEIKRIAPNGLDFAVESSGRPDVMLQALTAVRARGGVAAIVGNAKHSERLTLDPKLLNLGKQLRGTWGGDNNPDADFPRYADLIASGTLDLSRMDSTTYPLTGINRAIDDLESGSVLRPIIDMASS